MAEGVPITAAEASDLGCSHLSPSVGGSGPFLPRSLPCPTLCSPQPLGRWMVRSRIPGLGRGESVLGEGPGVRPCTGSDSQRPPNVSLREGLGGEGGHQRPALAPLPASGKRQNWGNRNSWESEQQLALCPQLLLRLPAWSGCSQA